MLNKNTRIFLSAGIPDEGREGFKTTNRAAVAAAVMAFTRVCAEYSIPFYFGGQPAITPLVWSVAKDFSEEKKPLITIYQSRFFEGSTPREVDYFENIVWTKSIGNNKNDSIRELRKQMFSENETIAAIFIGGSDGVRTEYKMLKDMSPKTRMLPFASTGGVSKEVFEREKIDEIELTESFAYYQIFNDLLKDYKDDA
ncbi:MAG: hypothetical protein J6T62_06110 [Fibrobacter sp.]|uniref:SLOG domain-containing protein n=1 Tax=uncultured Fibrobacter sp. TaxID=261512 RepID=UPI001B1B8C45|nr:hypothetical protein [uncultured Fibrobacter sp.]MBO7551079.1 hypothetical protein [Fibrobacter sp.]